MEGADSRARVTLFFPVLRGGFLVFGLPRQQAGYALLHFPRGLVSEGDAENIARYYAALEHVRDSESDHPRLAGPGACEDQNGSMDGFHSLSLLRVETVEIQHQLRSLEAGNLKAR